MSSRDYHGDKSNVPCYLNNNMSIEKGEKGRNGLKIFLQQGSGLTRSYQNKKWPAMSYTDELQ